MFVCVGNDWRSVCFEVSWYFRSRSKHLPHIKCGGWSFLIPYMPMSVTCFFLFFYCVTFHTLYYGIINSPNKYLWYHGIRSLDSLQILCTSRINIHRDFDPNVFGNMQARQTKMLGKWDTFLADISNTRVRKRHRRCWKKNKINK